VGVVEVDGPDGRRWTVSRRRYWPGWREVSDIGDADFFGFMDASSAAGIVVGIAIAILIGVLIVVLLPLVLLIAELLLVVIAIVLLGGVWLVEANTIGPPLERRTKKVWGGRRSERAAETIARELRQLPP
jgi:hypothetical protein